MEQPHPPRPLPPRPLPLLPLRPPRHTASLPGDVLSAVNGSFGFFRAMFFTFALGLASGRGGGAGEQSDHPRAVLGLVLHVEGLAVRRVVPPHPPQRSEERRVGKECISRRPA